MHSPGSLTHSIKQLRARLDYVNRAWTVDNYERMLGFFVDIVPRLTSTERCTIFILDPATGRIRSKLGTGLRDAAIEAPATGSVVGRAISAGKSVIDNELAAVPGFHHTADAITGFLTRSALCAPILGVTSERVTGAIQVLNKLDGELFGDDDVRLLEEVADYLSMALDNVVLSAEIARISGDINREVSRFQSDFLGDVPFVAESEAMRSVLELVRMVCDTPVNVLIQGENGTGKEVIARMIHDGRDRRAKPFVPVNCAAIPEHLMESEFFGYEKGAFTGAVSSRKGRFEEAEGGTLFLDEVAEIPLSMQPKFLRAVQESEGRRLGASKTVTYDVSLVSATNRNLRDLVAREKFRQDLFYRLFAVEIVIPPLRDRREDIAPLTIGFVDDVCRRFGKQLGGVSRELLALFEAYAWPGNVRQLRREVERLVALTPESQALGPERCSPELAADASRGPIDPDQALSLPVRVHALETQLIGLALARTHGNKGRAARLLGITRQGLYKKLKRYRIERGDAGQGDSPP